MSDKKITIYHSPDADDAFMFYGLTSGEINYPGYEFTHELCDIESLNLRALKGELDVSAASVHAFAHFADTYAVLTCGASMGGEEYGPCIVAKEKFSLKEKQGLKIASPGRYTSAHLSLQIYLKEQGIEAEIVCLDFDKVQDAVKSAEVDAGVIIHEGQLTHEKDGLTLLLDLGQWWWSEHQLPLPLGVNIVKKALGPDALEAVKSVLKGSIEYSLEHREAALDYALSYGRGITREEADRFVAMYVNEKTLDIGKDGVESIELFLKKGREYGFVPEGEPVEFV